MRVFFALLLPPEAVVSIESWRQLNWPQLGSPVPAANYHLTLNFVGDIEPAQIETLHMAADAVAGSSFDCHLDQMGFWPNGGIFWLGSSQVVQPLLELHKNIASSLGKAGVRLKSREFVPHLTLARRVPDLPVAPVVEPDFSVRFSHFYLMESVRDSNGIHYEPLLEWALEQ